MNRFVCSGYCKTVADACKWINDLMAFQGVSKVTEFIIVSEPNVRLSDGKGDYYIPFTVIAEVEYKV